MQIPGAPNEGGRWPRESGNPTMPLLPPWATEKEVLSAADDIVRGFRAHCEYINYQVETYGPKLVEQTEAFLKHEAEGW